MACFLHSSFFHNDNLIAVVEEVDLVGNEDQRLCLAQFLEALLMYLSGHLRVHSRDGIVQDEDIRVSVKCPCKSESRLLSSRQSNAFLANYRLIALGQNFEVRSQAGLLDYPRVALLFVGKAKEDVVSDGIREDDGLLLDIGDAASGLELAVEVGNLAEDDSQQSAFARADPASDAVEHSFLEEKVDIDERRTLEVVLPETVESLKHNISNIKLVVFLHFNADFLN